MRPNNGDAHGEALGLLDAGLLGQARYALWPSTRRRAGRVGWSEATIVDVGTLRKALLELSELDEIPGPRLGPSLRAARRRPGSREEPVAQSLAIESHWRRCASVMWELLNGTDATRLRQLSEQVAGGPDAGVSLRHPLAVSRRNRRIADREMEWHVRLGHQLHVDEPMRECRQRAIAGVGEPESEMIVDHRSWRLVTWRWVLAGFRDHVPRSTSSWSSTPTPS